MNLISGRLRRDLIDQRIRQMSDKLAAVWRMAELAHPERPLSKGYVRVTGRTGKTLTHSHEARAERALTLHFGDGAVHASVDDPGGAARSVERKPRRSYIAPQPGLFDRPEE